MEIFEYFKVVDIDIAQMIGSVEDERCFSTLAFTKSKLRNRFNDHLDLVVYMFAQKFYNLENFPYNVETYQGPTWLLDLEGKF
jgi:hypothetical protein